MSQPATRVDFYVLSQERPDARLHFACRLAERAVEHDCMVYVHTASDAQAQRLDELLWTFSDRSFLLHELYSGEPASHAQVKVMLGTRPAPPSHRQVLINLSDALPADIALHERIAEIVDADPERKRQARERFRQYRELGSEPQSHTL